MFSLPSQLWCLSGFAPIPLTESGRRCRRPAPPPPWFRSVPSPAMATRKSALEFFCKLAIVSLAGTARCECRNPLDGHISRLSFQRKPSRPQTGRLPRDSPRQNPWPATAHGCHGPAPGCRKTITRSCSDASGASPVSPNSLPEVIRSVIRPAIAEGVAGHGRIIDQLVAHEFADQIVVRQLLGDHLAISEFGDAAAAVQQDHLFEALIGLGILDHAQNAPARCRYRPDTDASRLEIVDDKRAGRLAADDDLVALLEVLQTRGQRPVRHLDRKEFERSS